MARPIAKDVAVAVHAARLYIGCEGRLKIRDQQRLYTRMKAKIAIIAKRRGMDEGDAYRQVTGEARRLGGICPLPGKDI